LDDDLVGIVASDHRSRGQHHSPVTTRCLPSPRARTTPRASGVPRGVGAVDRRPGGVEPGAPVVIGRFIWGEAGFFGGPFATLEPRWDGGAFAPLHFDPTAHQVFLLSLQLDPQLKPEFIVFEVPPGPTSTDADHGGEIVEVGDYRIEHLVADGRDFFWFTDRHGHSRVSDVLPSVRVGDCDLESAGIGDRRALEAPDGCIGAGPFTIEAAVSYRETLVARFAGRP
jgi:hypothetical protein